MKKMKKLNNKGFTLLEVIIVIIILAVLASLAIPKFTNTVTQAEAQEALNYFSAMREGMERCANIAAIATVGGVASYANCDTLAELGLSAPPASSRFTYTIPAASLSATEYALVATSRNGAANTLAIDDLGTICGCGTFTTLGGGGACDAADSMGANASPYVCK